MLLTRIAFILAAAVLLLAPTGPAAAAEPAPTVVSAQAEKGSGPNEFVFRATVAGVKPGDGRYQVLLQLAPRNDEFKDSDAKLLTPMAWDNAAAVWTATQTVDKFGRDKTRRYRVVVHDTASGASVAVGQDEFLRQPGKAPPISRQEALDFLDRLSKEYAAKNYHEFMNLVSPDFAGDDFVLANAVRKDFLLLNDIDLRFTVTGITANAEFATIQANYRRSVTPVRTGQRLNDSGLTELALYKEKGQLKLYSMKKPLLFGLAGGGVAATGTVLAGQNQNVIQIKKDGTVVVGPVASVSPSVKTTILHGYHVLEGTEKAEFLKIADGSQTWSSNMSNKPGDFAVTAFDSGNVMRWIVFNCGWQKLSVTNINSVTSIPASGYNTSGFFDSSTIQTAVYALHLNNGKYAVVEVTGWTGYWDPDEYGNPAVIYRWTATVLYKYQPDGTLNF